MQSTWRGGDCADLVIEIPGGGPEAVDGGRYRLDYWPAQGTPAPNITVPAHRNTINFVGLPGTKYHFMLYYSNDTFTDLLTWNQTIITGTTLFIITLPLAMVIHFFIVCVIIVMRAAYKIIVTITTTVQFIFC